ncbi:MAG: ATP-binding protein [Phycisphaerales bacterium]|nr:MAG: ATP-binding protein [Phycisphaerales bacterium]
MDRDTTPVAPTPLPGWYPAWARELANLYFSGTTCVFLLHGNVHDLVRVEAGGRVEHTGLVDFLASQLFGSWDVVLQYDLAAGTRPKAGSDPQRLREMVAYLSARLGDMTQWTREADKSLLRFDKLLERNLVEDKPAERRSIALLFDYAQYLVPAGGAGMMSAAASANLVRLLSWGQSPYLKKVNVAVCLVADKLAEINDRLVQSPHVATVEIPMPDTEARRRFIESEHVEIAAGRCRLCGAASEGDGSAEAGSDGATAAPGEREGGTTGISPARASHQNDAATLAEMSNGLSLVNLNVILSRARQKGGPIDASGFRRAKKDLIERQCQGLLEFITPNHTLDMVVGQEAAKKRLRADGELLTRGHLDAAPMGYLVSGPVGTGKTFLAECYAGSIGVPCVKLRNFRSKYVGETEGNLEHVLTVLRSLGPVVVIIDEADAALGDRDQSGDSGTSSRVFSMIASQMGDTRYRGRIVWMLLTCRPDLLPIDLKRQGRAEVHVPLFYPQSDGELAEMIQVLARKNRIEFERPIDARAMPRREMSGADIESVLVLARRCALADGRRTVRPEDVEAALTDFIPSVQGLEKQMQELASVLECTQLSFLTPAWRQEVEKPDGRTRLQERMAAIRQLIEQ